MSDEDEKREEYLQAMRKKAKKYPKLGLIIEEAKQENNKSTEETTK